MGSPYFRDQYFDENFSGLAIQLSNRKQVRLQKYISPKDRKTYIIARIWYWSEKNSCWVPDKTRFLNLLESDLKFKVLPKLVEMFGMMPFNAVARGRELHERTDDTEPGSP